MEVLFSKTGSSGNATVISDGQTMILIDAGISPEKINREIDYRLCESEALLCTHAHIDHTAYIKRFMNIGMKVYCGEETTVKTKISGSKRHIKKIESNKQFRVGTFIIVPFNVDHVNSDGTPCENFGFLIYSTVTKEKMLHITDAACIESKFPPVDYINIECNYIDIDDYSNELEYTNKFVEKRRFDSHLSLSRCIMFLKQQDLSNVKEIRLIHLTESQGEIECEILEQAKKEFPSVKFII